MAKATFFFWLARHHCTEFFLLFCDSLLAFFFRHRLPDDAEKSLTKQLDNEERKERTREDMEREAKTFKALFYTGSS